MLDRMTEDSRRAMALAQAEARRLGHEYIGTEHVLLALLDVPPVADLLEELGIHVDQVRREVDACLPLEWPARPTVRESLPVTDRAKRVLELGILEARGLRHTHVAPGHLLLGLLREKAGLGGEVLRDLGLDPARVRPVVAESLDALVARDPGSVIPCPRSWWRFW